MKPKKLPAYIKLFSLLMTIIFGLTIKGLTQANTWQQKASLPANSRFLATSFSIGTKGYIGLGFDRSVDYKDFWEYDPIAGTWTQKADYAGGSRHAAVGFSIGSKGYIGTGSNYSASDQDTKDFWEYDPLNNTWTRKADFAGTARTVAQGFSIGSTGYIGLGRTGGFGLFADFWQYDPGTNTWTKKADFGGGARYATSGFGIGTKGYIGTGTDFTGGGFTFRNDFWEYDQILDTWTKKADFGGGGRELAVGFSMNSRGYIGTGSGANDFWEYSPSNNSWTKKADFGGGGRNMAAGFSIAGKGYLGTGEGWGATSDFWQYSPSPPPPSTIWAKSLHGSVAPYTTPSISSDANGNTYVTGGFTGTLTFATTPSPTTLTSAGESDIFIAKYDPLGNVVWAKQAGGARSDVANTIKFDGFGNVYIGGSYQESATFESTTLSNSIPNYFDVFIAKYNAATGALVWVRKGTGGNSYYYEFNSRTAMDIAVDKVGDAYITGYFTGDITFAPLPVQNTGWWDIFVVKYNSSGVAQWITTAGSPEAGYYAEQGNGIAVDGNGMVYVTGRMNGSSAYPTQFGNIQLVSNGGGGFYESNFFLAKYNPSISSWVWAVNGGGNTNDWGNKVNLDKEGNLYVSGYFEGRATFGSNEITSIGGSDYFLGKYFPTGNLTWIHSVEGFNAYSSSKIDASGNICFVGTFDGTITVGDKTLTATGYSNSYLSGWNSNGDFQWVKHIPGSYYSQASAIDVESNGNINFLETFAQTDQFDCTVLNATSFWDLAIAKLGISGSGPVAPTINASSTVICTGTNTLLSISNENLNNATDWKWYTGSCGGTFVGSGTSITVSPTQNTTYYVRAEGGCGAPGACGSIAITINNASPVINSVTGPVAPVAVNTSISLNVAYTDNNIPNASINWGDASVVQAVANPANSFSVPHTYSTPGVYTVVVTLTNACGITGPEYKYQYVVVYDPSAGFVTGGGWINSPAGAYRPNITLSGKAIFGFESKYQKGATVPTGNTEFKFQVVGMNFKSTNYDWLVIAGSRAQYKGSGTINGSGYYGFLLTAVDGDLKTPASADLFRIKIWDKNNSDAIVYDNQYGSTDDAGLNTPIGGGSIIIHTDKNNMTANTSNSNTGVDLVKDIEQKAFDVKISPNPSVTSFKLIVQSQSTEAINIRLLDMSGRVLSAVNNVRRNETLTVGTEFTKGTYFAEVVQGTNRKVVKLIKR